MSALNQEHVTTAELPQGAHLNCHHIGPELLLFKGQFVHLLNLSYIPQLTFGLDLSGNFLLSFGRSFPLGIIALGDFQSHFVNIPNIPILYGDIFFVYAFSLSLVLRTEVFFSLVHVGLVLLHILVIDLVDVLVWVELPNYLHSSLFVFLLQLFSGSIRPKEEDEDGLQEGEDSSHGEDDPEADLYIETVEDELENDDEHDSYDFAQAKEQTEQPPHFLGGNLLEVGWSYVGIETNANSFDEPPNNKSCKV